MKEYLIIYSYRKEKYNCNDVDYLSSRLYEIDEEIIVKSDKKEAYKYFYGCHNREYYRIINIIELGDAESNEK